MARTSSPPYQVLNSLRPEEMEALRRDIAERGVLVPVEVDDEGNVLDGHHRVAIAEELGIRYRKIVRTFETDGDKVEHALKLNLLRRHLGPVAWAEAFRKLCRVRGVRIGSEAQKKNGNGKASREEAATVAALDEELGVAPRTARWRLRLADDLKTHKDLAQAVDAGEMESKAAAHGARTRNAKKEAKKKPSVRLPRSVRIDHCDFRNPKVRAGTVDLILTDPLYGKEFMPLWSDLGEFAARA